MSSLRDKTRGAITSKAYHELPVQDGNAKVRALCFALENLTKPIKLIRPELVFQLGRFPCYNENDFEFVPLDSSSVSRCIAVSHRWTDNQNSKNHLDAEWLKTNWSKLNKESPVVADPLLFYDFTALPQRFDQWQRDREDQHTFKAGLELIDHIFSQRAIVIPTKGYLFRYWCYVEFFIAAYNDSLLCGVPFVDPLPRDLATIDAAIFLIHKMIVKSECDEAVVEVLMATLACSGIVSLGEKTASDLAGFVSGLPTMKRQGKESTMKVGLSQFSELRAVVADMIRSRIRQCSLAFDEDRSYLDTVLSAYIDKRVPSVTDERYESWDKDEEENEEGEEGSEEEDDDDDVAANDGEKDSQKIDEEEDDEETNGY